MEILNNNNKKILITDTSVLINFLNLNRMDLLGIFPGMFVITQHVLAEVTNEFPIQQKILQDALGQKILEVIIVDSMEELCLFGQLMGDSRLGAGECSAIACAIHRNYALAMDDIQACKQAKRFAKDLEILSTANIMGILVNHDAISYQEADEIKDELKFKHRFDLKIESFLNSGIMR